MKLTPSQLNKFSMMKLPSAWLCGVRVVKINDKSCTTSVKHRWINQNPFNSMFWAVQGMAAELSTGAIMVGKIKEGGKNISMLVANNKASFTKKAKGRIVFECNDGHLIDEAIKQTIATGNGQTFWMRSIGKDETGDVVSIFDFEWTVRVK